MVRSNRDAPRGATPLPRKKESRQWSISLPNIRLGWVLYPLLLAVVVICSRWIVQSWPVTTIDVSGRMSFWDSEAINHELAWTKEKSFFSLDVDEVHQQVLALPLIMKVTVRKRWPGTLEVNVVEDIPVAVWNGNKLLSASGMLDEIPEGMNVSHLTGMQGPGLQAEEAVRYFRRIQQMLNAQSILVKYISISSTGSVRATLSNGWKVEFGRQYFEERVLRLEKLLQQLPADKVAGIDLRYGKGAAIRWRKEQEIG